MTSSDSERQVSHFVEQKKIKVDESEIFLGSAGDTYTEGAHERGFVVSLHVRIASGGGMKNTNRTAQV